MVACNYDFEAPGCRYVLRPNGSLSPRSAMFILGSLFVVYLAVGIPLALMGLWLVLPFAGLEFALLAGCLYAAMLGSGRCEVIWVRDGMVTVESGRRRPVRRTEFHRAWVRVCLHEPAHRWYPSRLTIGSHGRLVEVGSFLSETERRRVASELHQAIQAPKA